MDVHYCIAIGTKVYRNNQFETRQWCISKNWVCFILICFFLYNQISPLHWSCQNKEDVTRPTSRAKHWSGSYQIPMPISSDKPQPPILLNHLLPLRFNPIWFCLHTMYYKRFTSNFKHFHFDHLFWFCKPQPMRPFHDFLFAVRVRGDL